MNEVVPFLTLPFTKQYYKITEGWHYSEQEKSIHGFVGHAAVDFALKRGTPVLAAADGIAISSYLSFPVKNEDGSPRLYQGKPVGYGFGYFVQVYHPENGLYTAYGHLEKVAENIKFFKPRKMGEKLWPVGHKLDPNSSNYPGTLVKRGEVIGFSGDSGLTWGYSDYPKRPDPSQFPSWDEEHLHFEVFERYGSRKKKRYFDPYGIKGEELDYPDSYKPGKPMGEQGPILWILENELPKFINNE